MLFSKDGGLECKGDSLIQRIIKELKDRINFGYVDLTLVIYMFLLISFNFFFKIQILELLLLYLLFWK